MVSGLSGENLSGEKRIPGLSGAIIAAGRGERLRPVSDGVPKPLVELGGEPLIVRQSRALAALGARPVHAIVNSETAAMIRDRGLVMPPELEICVRDTANSMESLLALEERLVPGRFLMTTVDAFIPPAELAAFLKHALAQADPAASRRSRRRLGRGKMARQQASAVRRSGKRRNHLPSRWAPSAAGDGRGLSPLDADISIG